MKILNRLLSILLITAYGCANSQVINTYSNVKKSFDSTFIDQFPSRVIMKASQTYKILSNTDTLKNKIGLFLYEYNVKIYSIDSLESLLSSKNNIAKYTPNDSCLFIVNRFETKYTAEHYEQAKITDSTFINKMCYNEKLPVPNFANYKGDSLINFGLDSTFTIYVLDAKPGVYFEAYQKKPFNQMPKKWGNGYSKGIAISRKDKTVIYWSIMW